MEIIISGLIVIAGAIHLPPLAGMLGADRLRSLYQLSFDEPNLQILMRHRAVLFGLLGIFLIYAAFQPSLQPMAFIAGFISLASFLAIASTVGTYNNAIAKVFIADVIAIVSLTIALLLRLIA